MHPKPTKILVVYSSHIRFRWRLRSCVLIKRMRSATLLVMELKDMHDSESHCLSALTKRSLWNIMKDERVEKVLLCKTDEREVSWQLPLKLVDSPALFIPQTVLNNPFLTVLTHFSPHLIEKLCQKIMTCIYITFIKQSSQSALLCEANLQTLQTHTWGNH